MGYLGGEAIKIELIAEKIRILGTVLLSILCNYGTIREPSAKAQIKSIHRGYCVSFRHFTGVNKHVRPFQVEQHQTQKGKNRLPAGQDLYQDRP